ncbi:hypothetical protein T230_06510 [Tannerella sp. oral taxon BU063 isolate Cell 1/3]|uniref:Uncharacterized protein n=1 Tax=Tannerella sp. oral taxon BU063 isolate Cell 1/3 TaxID=1411022 RepID=W2CQL4_9BACT|nr:hypothetical protein T230_06510 [Tannerella sp. oral taxon BU063 isolate Cell 1/3]
MGLNALPPTAPKELLIFFSTHAMAAFSMRSLCCPSEGAKAMAAIATTAMSPTQSTTGFILRLWGAGVSGSGADDLFSIGG